MKKIIMKYGFLLLSVTLSLLSPLVSNAQQARKAYADKLFLTQEYFKAAAYYEDVANMTLQTTKENKKDWEAVRKAAVCRQFTNDWNKAENWYFELQKAGQMTEEDMIRYIEILRYNGKHQKAQEYILRESKKPGSNDWLKAYAEKGDYLTELKKDSALTEIKPEAFNSGMGDFAPAFFGEKLVYASQRRNTGFVNHLYGRDHSYFMDCYIVEKNRDNDFSNQATLLKKYFRTNAHDGPVSFNAAGDMAFITRNDVSKHKGKEIVQLKLYITYKNEKGIWSKPEEFPFNSKDKSYSVGHASLSEDGNTLYFASNMPGGYGGVDIWKSERDIDSWAAPQNLGNIINSERDEMFPYIGQDGTLYFASNGWIGMGGLDIFKAVPEKEGFTQPVNMGYPLNSHRDDFSLILDATGNTGYFSSNREENTDRIYRAIISSPEFFLDGTVVSDDGEKTLLPLTEVTIKNTLTGEEIALITDSLGKFSAQLSRNNTYEISAGKEAYTLLNTINISTMNKTKSQRFPAELVLESNTIVFTGKVVDKKTKALLTNAAVKINIQGGSQEWNLITDAEGMVSLVLDRKAYYQFGAGKKGYIAATDTFSTMDKTESSKTIEIELEKIKVGDVFAVKDIYYDYNKWNLRDTSKAELDKLAAFLLENNHIKIELSSHTDSRGSDDYNQQLSQKRAQSCVDYLILKGVPAANIVAKGYGESKPINRCTNGVNCSEEEFQQNRRTEIKILKVELTEE